MFVQALGSGGGAHLCWTCRAAPPGNTPETSRPESLRWTPGRRRRSRGSRWPKTAGRWSARRSCRETCGWRDLKAEGALLKPDPTRPDRTEQQRGSGRTFSASDPHDRLEADLPGEVALQVLLQLLQLSRVVDVMEGGVIEDAAR